MVLRARRPSGLEGALEAATALLVIPARYRRPRVTNAQERLNEEIHRPGRVIRTLPNRHSVIRLTSPPLSITGGETGPESRKRPSGCGIMGLLRLHLTAKEGTS